MLSFDDGMTEVELFAAPELPLAAGTTCVAGSESIGARPDVFVGTFCVVIEPSSVDTYVVRVATAG
jgi:hypothetical protein